MKRKLKMNGMLFVAVALLLAVASLTVYAVHDHGIFQLEGDPFVASDLAGFGGTDWDSLVAAYNPDATGVCQGDPTPGPRSGMSLSQTN